MQSGSDALPTWSSEQGPQRVLYYFPILHSRADMGGLGEQTAMKAIEKIGLAKWEAQCRSIEQGWARIEELIESLHLGYPSCRLYQDGLPVCGHELLIVRDLANSGSHNHQLLLTLYERGAMLMGTESPDLLIEEYQMVTHYLAHNKTTNVTEMEARSAELLKRRDCFIADRIAATLRPGESGLLFLGLLHSLEGKLPSDIRVICPIVTPVRVPSQEGQSA